MFTCPLRVAGELQDYSTGATLDKDVHMSKLVILPSIIPKRVFYKKETRFL